MLIIPAVITPMVLTTTGDQAHPNDGRVDHAHRHHTDRHDAHGHDANGDHTHGHDADHDRAHRSNTDKGVFGALGTVLAVNNQSVLFLMALGVMLHRSQTIHIEPMR